MSQRDRRSRPPEESGAAGRQAGSGASRRFGEEPPRGSSRRPADPDPASGSAAASGPPSLGTERPAVTFGDRRADPPGRLGSDPSDPDAWSDEAFAANPTDAVWDDVDADPVAAAAAARTVRRRARPSLGLPGAGAEAPRQGRPRRPRSPAASPLPALLGRLEIIADRVALGLLGAGLLSLAAMAAVVASRMGGAEPFFPVHVDAVGQPDRWGGPRILWRLPLLAGLTLATNLVLAWALAPIDRFAARFLLAAGLVIHLLVWVALLDLL